jgi:hypothetical protein
MLSYNSVGYRYWWKHNHLSASETKDSHFSSVRVRCSYKPPSSYTIASWAVWKAVNRRIIFSPFKTKQCFMPMEKNTGRWIGWVFSAQRLWSHSLVWGTVNSVLVPSSIASSLSIFNPDFSISTSRVLESQGISLCPAGNDPARNAWHITIILQKIHLPNDP